MAEIGELTPPGVSARRFELRWFESEARDAEGLLIESTDSNSAAQALRWARARADVVVVVRPSVTGFMVAFSAGPHLPSDDQEMPQLDETSMISGTLAPAPPLRTGLNEDTGGITVWPTVPRPVTPEPYFTTDLQTTEVPQRRLDAALDRVQGAVAPVSLQEFREILLDYGFFSGDDELSGRRESGGHFLFAIFDHADSTEVVHYVLVESDARGRISDVHLVHFTRHVRVWRDSPQPE